jgi:hypothetical protein
VGDRGSCGVKWGIMAEDGIHSVDEKGAVRSGISAEEGGKKEDVAPCGEEMIENRVESASAERNEDSQVDASNVDVVANVDVDDPVGGGEVASGEEASRADGNASTLEEAAGDVEGAPRGNWRVRPRNRQLQVRSLSKTRTPLRRRILTMLL